MSLGAEAHRASFDDQAFDVSDGARSAQVDILRGLKSLASSVGALIDGYPDVDVLRRWREQKWDVMGFICSRHILPEEVIQGVEERTWDAPCVRGGDSGSVSAVRSRRRPEIVPIAFEAQGLW